MVRETITCTANGGKTYEVTFDGDEVVSVDVIQSVAHVAEGRAYTRRVWTRGRGAFGSKVVEDAKAAARALRIKAEAA